MKLSEYIINLQEFLEKNGDGEVCITQSGYYSDGPLAELYEFPEAKSIQKYYGKPSVKMIALGHSHQSY
jgi:hypothetical protein